MQIIEKNVIKIIGVFCKYNVWQKFIIIIPQRTVITYEASFLNKLILSFTLIKFKISKPIKVPINNEISAAIPF